MNLQGASSILTRESHQVLKQSIGESFCEGQGSIETRRYFVCVLCDHRAKCHFFLKNGKRSTDPKPPILTRQREA